MRLKIICDGDNTRVVCAETGRPVENVVCVEFGHDRESVPCATITIIRPQTDLTVDAAIVPDRPSPNGLIVAPEGPDLFAPSPN